MIVAINGFGRIGKQFFLACMEQNVDWEFIINDHADADTIVYSLLYDSVHPKPTEVIFHDGKWLRYGAKKIKLIQELDITKLPWKKEKVDLVVECTGHFTKKADAIKHIKAGAKKVLISAPAKDHDITIVYGVNHKELDKNHNVVSAGSCTTNCVSPLLKVLNDNFKIKVAHFVTTHAYTSTQHLIDMHDPKDLRRGRAAAANIVPTTSGASLSVVESLPVLQGKLDGYALRVPIIDGSLTSIIAVVEKKATVKQVNEAFKKASSELMKGIIEYSQDPLVSSDIIHKSSSAIFDSGLTKTLDNTISIAGWYDNEWGYSNRLFDVANLMIKFI